MEAKKSGMKGKLPNLFSKKGRERRCAGQALAAAVLIVCLTAAGAVTGISAGARLEVQAAAPAAVQTEPEAAIAAINETTETPAEAETSVRTETQAEPDGNEPARPDSGAEPAPEPGDEAAEEAAEEDPAPAEDVPAAPAEEAPAEEPAAPAEEPAEAEAPAPAALEEENGLSGGNTALMTLSSQSPWQDETPALSAEDPLAARYEITQALAEVNQTQQLLLTPDELDTLLASDRCIILGEENLLDWLFGSEYNFLQWLFDMIFGSWGSGETPAPEYSGWKTIDGNTYYYDPVTHQPVTGIQTVDGKIYYFDGDGIMRPATFGIDVSKYQQNVDWKKVKQAGAEFAIIRIGYRGYSTGALALDPMFETHLAGAKAAGLRVGVYIFSQAINEEEAREEAFACSYVLNGRVLDYPVYFDSEYAVPGAHTGRADKLTKAQRTACAVAFCEEIQKYGYEPGVYASTNWFSTQLDMNALKSYSIWNAHYGISKNKIDCDLWQGTCEGRIDGISGNVDINISYFG